LKTKPITSSVTNLKPGGENYNDVFFDRKLEVATSELTPYFGKLLYKMSKENAWIVANYIASMRTEVNLSDHYRRDIIHELTNFSIFCNGKSFRQITRDDVLAFLDSFRKAEDIDPLHKWIGTYNTYRMHLIRFFKWLHYPDIEPDKRPKPEIIENIFILKRKEQSIYKPSDLWTEEDDVLFLRYCPTKRMKCYHAISRDTSCRPHEILKLRIKDIVFKTAGNHSYAEVLVNGKTGSRHIPLINSIPYLKDYLDHEHPQGGNPNSIFISGAGKSLGKKMQVGAIYQIYDRYKTEYFPKLLGNPTVSAEDKDKIKELLKKPWNQYIRRHSALTQKSKFLKEHVLRQHAGWSGRSQMHLKYLHYYGNESNESILEAYGIITKEQTLTDTLRPKQCPNCNEPNKPDGKFCAKCRMVLTYDAYSETLESEKQKEDKLSMMEERFNTMQTQIQTLITALGSIKDQKQIDQTAQMLYRSGILNSSES
jgi:integrase